VYYLDVAFSPDGELVAASSKKTVRLWRLDTGEELPSFVSHRRAATAFAFTKDGSSLISAGRDKDLCIWELDTGKLLTSIDTGCKNEPNLALCPDGKRFISGYAGRPLTIRDVKTGKELGKLGIPGFRYRGGPFDVSPDGELLAMTGGDYTVRLIALATKKELHAVEGHRSCVTFAGFSSDGKYALSADERGKLVLWDAAADKMKAAFTVSGDEVYNGCVGFSASGKRVLVCSGDDTLEVWDPARRKRLATLGKESGTTEYPVAIDPQGKTAATVTDRTKIQLWDVNKTRVKRTLDAKCEGVTALAFSPDGKRLVAGSGGGILVVWEVRTGEAINQWTLPEEPSLLELARMSGSEARFGVETLSITADGGRLLTGDSGKNAILWDLDTGRVLARFKSGDSAAIAPDGSFAVAASAGNKVFLLDLAENKIVDEFELPRVSTSGYAVAFAPDSRTFVIGTPRGVLLRFEIVEAK
ncbi:WD40 repeat domain-containing protein, partial [Planctomycetota bacterium]